MNTTTNPQPNSATEQWYRDNGIVNILRTVRPKRDKYIAEGKYGFGIVDGSPAMRCCWTGGFFSRNDVFHFQKQAEGFVFMEAGLVKSLRRDKSVPFAAGGLLSSLVASGVQAAWRAATTKTKGILAFALSYRNQEGHGGVFIALAPEDFVNQIAACLPPDKIKDDRKKTE
jgi:hypothetical protein